MKMRRILIALLFTGGLAHAEDARRPVNLLASVPSTVAVSSTVANANLVPEHLVDGKLSTAWNSKTGELVGAWIAVRLPADVQIKTIKLTAGFVHKNQSGDLFTLNPRIKKVRISRAGQFVVEQTLDVENRGLQEIAVDMPGGDFEIRVLEVVPGSKPNWRETCISELEVWGLLGATVKQTKARPAVRIGSLDAPPTLTREQCIRAVYPTSKGNRIGPDRTDEAISAVAVLPFRDDVVICRIDHAQKGETTTTTELAAVRRSPKPTLLGTTVSESVRSEDSPNEGKESSGSISLAVFPLTLSESGLLVDTTQRKAEPGVEEGETSSKLYRITSAGLVLVLEYQSTWSEGESWDAERCELQPVVPTKAMPHLVLECSTEKGSWHGEDPRGNGLRKKTHRERYVWKGSTYEKK